MVWPLHKEEFFICNGMMHKAKFELEYLFLKNFRIALRQDVREAQIKYGHTAETSDCCESRLTIWNISEIQLL